MKCADPQPARRLFADQLLHTCAHLAGGLVGERNCEDVPWRDTCMVDEMGDPPGEYTGFSRASAGEHQQRPGELPYGGALLRIQFLRARRRHQLVPARDRAAARACRYMARLALSCSAFVFEKTCVPSPRETKYR